MDFTQLIYGADYGYGDGYQHVSLVFGLAILICSYLVDRCTEVDYAFWGYLFGMFAFWGGLTPLEDGGEIDWFFYGLVNLGFVLLSVLLQRRVFLAFGSVGVFRYVGHLAWEIVEDSLVFPFVLSAVGLAIIALGILYARKNRDRVERRMLSRVPDGLKHYLPAQRTKTGKEQA